MTVIKTFPRKVKEIDNCWIPMPDGVKLAARIWMPADAEKKPVPAILEYIPYRKRDGTIVRDQLTHPYFAGHGYAAVRVDMRGNGDSEGVMRDEYTREEQDDAVAVIAWLIAQPWCSGRLGMMGISWGGFNGLQVAARRPPGLRAIITLCSTDDRYADDIHYKGGCLLNENLGWSATMLAYSSRPPDPMIVGKRWKKMWMERLKKQPFLAPVWLKHPHRDAYWKHGSVCEDWSAIDTPALCIGGWNDAYSNAVPRLMLGLKSPAKAIIGPWAHKYPHFALPEPRIGFLQEALRWWDFWLKDKATGVKDDPPFRTYVMDLMRPSSSVTHIPGRFVSDQLWPSAKSVQRRFFLNGNRLETKPGPKGEVAIQSPQTTGMDGGEYCIIWLGPEFPGDQRRDDSGSAIFDSPPLTEDLVLVGAPVITLSFMVDQPVAFVAARLNSVWPDGPVSRLTYHLFNLCHRSSHENPEPLEPGRHYTVKIKLDDTAMRIPAGNTLRLSLSTAYWPMMWPAPHPAKLVIFTGESFVDVPSRPLPAEELETAFPPIETAQPLKRRVHSEPFNRREITIDQTTGEMRLTIIDDFGRFQSPKHGLTTWECGRETYSILPGDPLSARQEAHWTEELSRGRWKVRTETYSDLRATARHWLIKGRLEAYEGGRRILTRTWNEKIERKLG